MINDLNGPSVATNYCEIYNPNPIPSLLALVYYPKVLY